jgi:hypothetical protein
MWVERARDLETTVASREVTPVGECLSAQTIRPGRATSVPMAGPNLPGP